MKNIVAGAILIALSMVAACSNTDNKTESRKTAEVNSAAPDFTLRDISGNDVSLSAMKGKVLLLEFWATWCPPCRASVPELTKIQKKYADKNFSVIGISIDSGADAVTSVTRFAAAYGINYPLVVSDDSVQKAYNIVSIPTYVLIGRDGIIVNIYQGYSDNFHKKLSDQIEGIL